MVGSDERPEVALSGAGKRYGRGPWVLRDVSLELPGGGLVLVGGANGSGKSTLLRLVAGATRPSSGQVVGRPRLVGYAPERFPAVLRFTPRGYLRTVARLKRLGAGAEADIAHVLDGVGLAPYADVAVGRLSKGTVQKLVLGQSLLGRPRLLVLDEPWSGLDAAASAWFATALQERLREGALVVLADHEGRHLTGSAVRLLVEAGGVCVEASAVRRPVATGTRIVLRGRPDWAPGDTLAVLASEPTGAGVTVTVADAATDAVLLDALNAGLSVESVERCAR